MSSVICMPTYKRPEMLALALERINQAVDAPDDVRIFLDYSSDEITAKDRLREVEYVRDEYFPEASLYCASAHVDTPGGMWNILRALKEGFNSGAKYVFIIEEDVFINLKEFFPWHYQAQVSGNWFATCGRRMPRRPDYNQYTNPGACFDRDMLALIIPHIKDEMFADRRAYYDKYFGVMDEVSDLDDGLIRRIAKFHGLEVKYPNKPKVAHIGFRAYNHYMDWVNVGSIEHRIEKLRKMLVTIDPNNRFTRDFEPYFPA